VVESFGWEKFYLVPFSSSRFKAAACSLIGPATNSSAYQFSN
jgi:hypothetical protein